MSDLWRPLLVLFTFLAVVVIVLVLIFSGGGDDADDSASDETPKVSSEPKSEASKNPDAESVRASGIEVGDCIANAGLITGNLRRVDKIDCDKRHDGEVYTIIKLADAEKYPGLKFVTGKGLRGCRARLRRQVARKEFSRGQLNYKFFYPTRESWDADEHEVTCFATFTKPRKTKLAQRKAAA
jgi:hypothetical protein